MTPADEERWRARLVDRIMGPARAALPRGAVAMRPSEAPPGADVRELYEARLSF